METFQNKKVNVKGCGEIPLGENLYVANRQACNIVVVSINTQQHAVFAGDDSIDSPDCNLQDGIANQARFNYPQDITTDGNFLYVADSFNIAIRKISNHQK